MSITSYTHYPFYECFSLPFEIQNNWRHAQCYNVPLDEMMQIFDNAKGQMGNEYYMVKNSCGDYGEYHGMFYASKAFVRYKTMNFVVHKDAIPKDIKKKLGIKVSE